MNIKEVLFATSFEHGPRNMFRSPEKKINAQSTSKTEMNQEIILGARIDDKIVN